MTAYKTKFVVCVMLSFVLCAFGYAIEMSNEENRADSLFQQWKPKINIGIYYSPGLAHIGSDLGKKTAGGPFDVDVSRYLYWNNILKLSVRYAFKPKIRIGACCGLMWASLAGRSASLEPLEPYESDWFTTDDTTWTIQNPFVSFTLGYRTGASSNNWWLNGGIEYYFTKGTVKEIQQRYNTETESFDSRTVEGVVHARGFGFVVSVGFEKPLSTDFWWNLNIAYRHGSTQTKKRELSQDDITWRRDVDYIGFSGIYLEIGLHYSLL